LAYQYVYSQESL